MTILVSILIAISTSAIVFAAMTVKGRKEYRAKVHEIISGHYDDKISLMEENYELHKMVISEKHDSEIKSMLLDQQEEKIIELGEALGFWKPKYHGKEDSD